MPKDPEVWINPHWRIGANGKPKLDAGEQVFLSEIETGGREVRGFWFSETNFLKESIPPLIQISFCS